jgi:hypothetical protein
MPGRERRLLIAADPGKYGKRMSWSVSFHLPGE